MSVSQQQLSARPALDMIEEATQLLRRAPAGVWLSYYIGAIPAALGTLYFFADMSQGAFADEHLVEAALAVAVLYLWMKCWQTVFACGLLDCLAQEPARPWTWRRIGRMIVIQTALQPMGLFLRLIAAQVLLPYLWVYGFYQSVGVLGDGQSMRVGEVSRRSWEQARLWPRQAHLGLGLLWVFALSVALNLLVGLIVAPQLLRTFFGIETVFSNSVTALFNTTLLAVIVALTYLVFDPLRKAFYVLRCFQGAALRTGEDLRLKFKKSTTVPPLAQIALLLWLLLSIPCPAVPAVPTAPTAPIAPAASRFGLEAGPLDTSLEQVINRREFIWRLPRKATPEASKGGLVSFLDKAFAKISDGFHKLWDGMEKIYARLRKALGGDSEKKNAKDEGDASSGLFGAGEAWVYAALMGLVAVLASLLSVLALRFLRQRRRTEVVVAEVAPVLDLRSEQVDARQLPEEGWLKLARELREAGELRLALRASYLAGLAHLGQRDLITLARFKSNNDYARELQRRARARQELLAAFGRNLGAFEAAWYGLHEVTLESLGFFQSNLEKIREC